jgi:uncharacterized protein YyaL (SSP411 family)
MNRLVKEHSPYLRHAADQKIDWRPWSDEAFEQAKREDKPVFLSSGGVWCHWCHVMAQESFEDDEVAGLMNELFINIKLDRDERPDIDRRYQQSVAAMGGGSGWPLSVFLTPDRKPFFGGTYFPPEDRQGRPGFKNVLRAVNKFYKEKRQDAEQYADRVVDALRIETAQAGDFRRSSLDDAVRAILTHFDPQNGGFGAAPKFPMPGALEFLIHRHFMTQDRSIGLVVRRTLEAMARGGFHDQLAGGFHRYSTDEGWVVPHFEKMADDNAWLLRNYIDAYALFGDQRFKETAEGIIRFAREVLSDPAGGFYASQDADVTPDDEGGYFTWTDAEFQKVLTGEESRVLSLHLLHERGAMHHDAKKKVLFIATTPEEIAEDLDKPLEEVMSVIRAGKEKLLAQRLKREAPFIDTTLYTSLNGMFIASYLRAFRILGDPALKEFGLKSLDRVMRERLRGDTLYHSEGVAAAFDDYVYLIEALVAAYEAAGGTQHLDQAEMFMEQCIAKFGDGKGGFFDTEAEVLGARLKRVEDIPHPSANAVAAMLLLKLHHITGKDEYLRSAEKTLTVFSGSAAEYSIHAGSYFCALDAYYHTLRLNVEANPESELARAARSLGGPYTAVLYGGDSGRVVPCFKSSCYEPVTDPARLKDFSSGISRA